MGFGPSSVHCPIKAVRLTSRFVHLTTISTDQVRTNYSADRTEFYPKPNGPLPTFRFILFSPLSLSRFFFETQNLFLLKIKIKGEGKERKFTNPPSPTVYCYAEREKTKPGETKIK